MTDVTVTQADKLEAEAFWQEYGPFRMGTVSALAAAFARHRIAALADAQVEAVALQRTIDRLHRELADLRAKYVGALVHSPAQGEAVAWEQMHDDLDAPIIDRTALTAAQKADGWTEEPLFRHPPAHDGAALEQVADDVHAALWKAEKDVEALVEASKALLEHYTELVNCGDCGNWDPEVEPQVINMRTALAKHGGA